MKSIVPVIVLAWCLLMAYSSGLAQPDLQYKEAFPNVTFSRAVGFEHHGTSRIYIVQQTGEILTLPNEPAATTAEVFLDLSGYLGEDAKKAGMLSLAFHPDYSTNGYFYVYYVVDQPTTSGQDTLHSVLSRFQRSETDSTKADPTSEQVILEIPQPTISHNGGEIAFGPKGYLYLSLGEGSHGKDKFRQAQDRTTLLGSLIRIDVDNPSQGRAYGIPEKNPYVGNTQGYREEIYAYGFRNPWRLSIDAKTGELWIGDVGEQKWEEVNLVTKGGNYGWPIMEGNQCFDADTCDQTGLIRPVVAYPHSKTNGGCITGGHVYRGSALPELQGKYVYGDWISGQLWALEKTEKDTVVTPLAIDKRTSKKYPAFGMDKDGELYFLSLFHGTVHRFEPKPSSPADPDSAMQATETLFTLDGPNPSPHGTTVSFSVAQTGPVHIAMYDMLGRKVTVLLDKVVTAGTSRQLQISTADLPPGMYLCRMQTPGFTQTHKVLTVR